MQIRAKIKKLLNEIKGVTYSYGCVMLYFDIPKDKWDKIQDLIDDKDISKVDDADGRETEPHVTVLYGIHSDVPDADVEKYINELTAPEITLKKIGMFDGDSDVVKFDIDCPELKKMNTKFKKLPHTTKHKDYHPHATIAFVKKGEGEKYIQELSDHDSIVLTPNKIVYSKPDGSKNTYKFKK